MLNSYLVSTFVLLIIFCSNTQQQNVIPPIACPDYFQYFHDGTQHFGRIIIPTVSNSIEIVVYFSQKQPLQSNYYGQIILESRQPITYKVIFPNPNEVPKLTKITLNGQDICMANEYAPPMTRLFLNHKLEVTDRVIGLSQPQNTFNQRLPPQQQPPPQQQQNINNNPNFITLTDTAPNRFSTILQVQPTKQVAQFEQNPPKIESREGPSFNQLAPAPPVQYAQCGEENAFKPFVFGGDEVVRGQFPWLTAIYVKVNGLRFLCGGSLLSTRSVLTAAHCFKYSNSISADRLVVNLGRHNLEDYSEQGFETREIQSLIVHPEFSSNIFPDADLAILHLQKSVQYTPNIRPICLWAEPADSSRIVGQTGIVAGWGADENGRDFTPVPKKVSTNIVSESECLRSSPKAYSSITSARTFCAGNRDGSGPCMGDSGSGLMINRNGRWYLRGVVSAGQTKQQKCNLQEYVVFCDVAKHLQWVQSQMVS